MPLIEELPVTTTQRVTHGWAYVPDTGSTAIAAVQPGNRKRGHAGGHQRDGTVKQQKAVQLRLASLDKENYKDGVTVSIPNRGGGEKKNHKMTPNVRRILTYQRGFAHYLADEEANSSGPGATTTTQPPSSSSLSTQPSVATARGGAKRKSTTTAAGAGASEPSNPPSGPSRRGRKPSATTQKDKEDTMPPPAAPAKKDAPREDVQMTDAPAPASTSTSTPTTTTTTTTPASRPPYSPALDAHPLLRTTGLPKNPTARVLQQLLAEPAPSYAGARARADPSSSPSSATADDDGGPAGARPPRRFCGVCGFWGRVRCRPCGEWTCGLLECWRGHEGVCVAQGGF